MVNNIRPLRKSAGLTMKQFGALMGVSESTISLYETGKNEPDIKMLIKMAEYFGVTLDTLVGCNPSTQSDETKKQPTTQGDELDNSLVSMLMDLNPQDAQRVRDFVQGLKAARTEQPSQNP